MAYSNCECGFCPRILYYSNIRTAYHGLPVGTESRENNLRTMELYAPVPDQQRSFGYDRVSHDVSFFLQYAELVIELVIHSCV